MNQSPKTSLPIDYERPPQFKTRYCLGLAVLSGLLLTLCYEPFNLYGLAWIAFVPFLLSLRGRKDKDVFWAGVLLGYTFLCTSLFWLRAIHFSIPFLLAFVWAPLWGFWAWVSKKMCFYLCFPNVNTTLADARKQDFSLNWYNNLLLIVASAAIWVFLEWWRSWMLSGFPWNLLGVSQAYFRPVLPLASIFGVLGISFLLIWVNLAIAVALETWFLTKKIHWQLLFITLVICLSPLLVKVTPDNFNSASLKLKIVLVQGDFDPITERKPTKEDYLERIQTYRNLSLAHAVDQPDLIIWPETAILNAATDDPLLRQAVQEVARRCQSNVLFGAIHREVFDGVPRTTNAAFLVDSKGEVLDRYDKTHLVPYGEYTPMKNLLPSAVWQWLSRAVAMGELSPGNTYNVIEVKKGLKAGVNICFEDVFAGISHEFFRNGATFLITLTNDSWYRQTAGGSQHKAQAVFRAVENGVPLVRCGTTSESCVILADGTITGLIRSPSGDRNARGTAVLELNINRVPVPTFYYQNPHFFIICTAGLACLAFLLTALHFLQRKSRLRQVISRTS